MSRPKKYRMQEQADGCSVRAGGEHQSRKAMVCKTGAAAGKSRSAMHAGLSGVSGLRVMIGPPVSRPPATFYITECGGMSPVAALIIILALLSLVLQ